MKHYDLVVAGGGISGVAAAVSAAREGLSVLLAEETGVLGGAMSNCLVYPYMRFTLPESKRVLSAGIFSEMRARKDAYPDDSWEAYKFVFDDMVTEAGVEVLFHAQIFEVKTEKNKVKSLTAAVRNGTVNLTADYFVDATGDGEVFFLAGCDCQQGRSEDGLCQPMTTCFRVGNVNVERFKAERPMLEERYKQYREAGKLSNPRENILVFFGPGENVLHFNTTRVVRHDPTDPLSLSRAEIAARRQIREMMDFFRENAPSFKNAVLVSIAGQIGVRESRMLKGVHVLTAEELETGFRFEDTVALGNYGIDIHNPAGTGTEVHHLSGDDFYCIPYRSLLPKEYDNLLVAGRCLSATHEAQSAVRIMPICATLGEAAGVAVALAKQTNGNAHDLDVRKLQQKLREKGAELL